jgi:hypothetical protein
LAIRFGSFGGAYFSVQTALVNQFFRVDPTASLFLQFRLFHPEEAAHYTLNLLDVNIHFRTVPATTFNALS